jgi:hypothetical protein
VLDEQNGRRREKEDEDQLRQSSSARIRGAFCFLEEISHCPRFIGKVGTIDKPRIPCDPAGLGLSCSRSLKKQIT